MATMIKEDLQHAPTKDLVTGLLTDMKVIASGEVSRMQGEMKDEFKNLRTMMMTIAASVGFLVLSGILIAHTIAWILVALGLPTWAGYLIAAGILIAAGAVILVGLPKDTKQADMYPEESVAKLKGDIADLRAAVRR